MSAHLVCLVRVRVRVYVRVVRVRVLAAFCLAQRLTLRYACKASATFCDFGR